MGKRADLDGLGTWKFVALKRLELGTLQPVVSCCTDCITSVLNLHRQTEQKASPPKKSRITRANHLTSKFGDRHINTICTVPNMQHAISVISYYK
jgi:hypothetical protein